VNEEVARVARKHDARSRRVDALVAELGRGLAQPLPRLSKILGEIVSQRRLGRRPAVVRLAFLDPLLAVMALVSFHPDAKYRSGATLSNWLRHQPIG